METKRISTGREVRWVNGTGAASQPIFAMPPDGVWRMLAMMFTAQTSAVAANRYFGPALYEIGTNILLSIYVDTGTQAANLGRTHCWMAGAPATLGVDTYVIHSCPSDIIIQPRRERFTIILINSDGGDRYSGQRLLIERVG